MATARSSPSPAPFSWRGWRAGLVQFVFCYGVMPNLPFWMGAQRAGVAVPAWFNLDALGLGLVALFVRPGWLVAAMAGDFLLDVAYAIRATYGTDYTDIFLSFRYFFSAFAWQELLRYTAIVTLAMAGIGWVWMGWRPQIRGRERLLLVAVMVAVLAPAAWQVRGERLAAQTQMQANAARGYVDTAQTAASYRRIGARVLNSPVLALVHAWRNERMGATLAGANQRPMLPAASAAALAMPLLAQAQRPANLVVVLVESWGAALDPALRDALAAPFASAAVEARYQVRTGLVGFRGATPEGELRELCGAKPAPGSRVAPSPAALLACLGPVLRARGYQTTAMDSATAFWPGGDRWYQALGFDNVLDYPKLRGLGLAPFTAGPFRAVRDDQVAALLPGLLEHKAAPQFVFFLTLGAHMPVHLPLPAGFDADCSVATATHTSATACGWYRIERNTLGAVAAAALAPQLPRTVFVVVGDHAPPFADSTTEYFSPTQVPYALLEPR